MSRSAGLALALLALALPATARGEPVTADAPGAGAWLRRRIANAKKGVRETVELPLARASAGWGCTCPDFYVGTDPNSSGDDDGWLEPTAASAKHLPRATRGGYVEVVDGYFTGKTTTSDGDLPGHPYHPAVFVVTRAVHAYRDDHASDAQLRILATRPANK